VGTLSETLWLISQHNNQPRYMYVAVASLSLAHWPGPSYQ